ncbi:hypothetical protein EIP91_005940 [Steccherinum ochraceum]|uniref:Uncharacterized protein n=1 Tax=Steccherinum ochraceum TaxID=92696 RepID=A0A4R0RRJ3_9APHY|nr:hypothetical protein EIP91_005940 [Steccherinum ochraceum]
MHRATPLQELPLDQFLPTATGDHTTPTRSAPRSSKRPLSPGTPTLFSPAKRRILNEEGIFVSGSQMRSPLLSCTSRRSSSVNFHALLQGPDSPVKKLDFTPRKTVPEDNDLVENVNPHSVTNVSLHASPKRRGGRTTSPRSATRPTDLLVQATPRSKLVTSATRSSMPESVTDDCFSPRSNVIGHLTSSTSLPTLIPRELIPTDPQSIHYPGFEIHLDVHDYAPSARALAGGTAADRSSDQGADKVVRMKDVDNEKENLAPRNRPSRSKSTPETPASSHSSWSKADSRTSDGQRKLSGMSGVSACTPRSMLRHGRDIGVGSSPKSRNLRATDDTRDALIALTPSHAAVGSVERSRRKLALQDEVDAVDAEDDD